MKFMKLGSKPDLFQADGDIRYVASKLATDLVVNLGDIKFYVHKFPLLSKSPRLQKLVATPIFAGEVDIHDIPGGPAAFEICAKFCYGMAVTLNAYNVAAARCAAEYLEMYEMVDKGNLVYKIDVFLTSSILHSWKDSIIVLRTTAPLLPWPEELKIVSRCLESVANRASTDPSRVNWSYTYGRRRNFSVEDGTGLKRQPMVVPRDWWVEDLCELPVDLYKRAVTSIRAKAKVGEDLMCESLKAYALKRVPHLGRGEDGPRCSYLVDTIIHLLPAENSTGLDFLLRLLQASIVLGCEETGQRELMRKITVRLDEAHVADFLIRSPISEMGVCNIDLVRELVERFVMGREDGGFGDVGPRFCAGEESKVKVARLVDGYLAEAARDSSLPLSKFVGLAEMVSGFPRSSHDGIYRAVDMYLKEHPFLTKSEKKRVCQLIDCNKLSPEACAHAVQNERLPMRAIVQVLFFEQARSASRPNTPGPAQPIPFPRGSYTSSRSATTTNSDEDWDGDHTPEDRGAETGDEMRSVEGRVKPKKVGKILSRLWSGKERRGEASGSDISEGPTLGGGDTKVNGGRITTNVMLRKLV